MPDSRPTTVPVWPRSCSCSLATIGVTVDSSAAGATTATMASSSVADASPVLRVASPVKRTTGSVSSVSAAATSRIGPISRPGSVRSAIRPPVHAPTAMASRAEPITAVLVCRVTPTYGAISRSARISSTSTAAAETKTTNAAKPDGNPARTRPAASVPAAPGGVVAGSVGGSGAAEVRGPAPSGASSIRPASRTGPAAVAPPRRRWHRRRLSRWGRTVPAGCAAPGSRRRPAAAPPPPRTRWTRTRTPGRRRRRPRPRRRR